MCSERKRMERWPRLTNLRMWYSPVKDFTMSPWFSPIVLCVYRGIAFLYLMSWWVYNMSTNMQEGKFFIYFTNLSFTVVSFYFAIGMNLSCITIMQRRDQRYGKEDENIERQPLATLVYKGTIDKSNDFKMTVDKEVTVSENVTTEEEASTLQACVDAPTAFPTKHEKSLINTKKFKSSIEENEEDEGSDHSFSGTLKVNSGIAVCYQVYWLLYTVSTNTSVLLAIGHWKNVFEDQSLYLNVITKEVVGMGLVVMETLICGIPVRLCHMVYPMLFTILYIVFTAIYWASGGTDTQGRSYVYRLLDYEHISLWSAGIVILTVFVVQPLIQFAFYILFVSRRFLGNLCRSC